MYVKDCLFPSYPLDKSLCHHPYMIKLPEMEEFSTSIVAIGTQLAADPNVTWQRKCHNCINIK